MKQYIALRVHPVSGQPYSAAVTGSSLQEKPLLAEKTRGPSSEPPLLTGCQRDAFDTSLHKQELDDEAERPVLHLKHM